MSPHRPIPSPRAHAIAATFQQQAAELDKHLRPDAPDRSLLLAYRLLETDDAAGASKGLIVQGDAVTWAMVDALVDLALYGSQAHAQLAHGGGLAANCLVCQLTRETSHTALLDPVTERRRTTATELHTVARAALLDELSKSLLPQHPG